jgi:hypothetical protein
VADAKLSALAAATGLNDADLLLLTQSGVSKSTTLNLLTAYIESRGRQVNSSTANQAFAAVEAYVTGSDVLIPANRLQAKSIYRARMQLTKTSTTGSTGTPIIAIKTGTAATTADTTRATLTFPAQTAVADSGFFDIYVTFRVVGASAVISASAVLDHGLPATGLVNTNTGLAKAVSAAFDVTPANTRIGFSFNGGASFAGNTDLVQAELMNLA